MTLIVVILSSLFVAQGLVAENQGDIAWYQWIVHDWVVGNVPYIGHTVEYPPYALIIFFLPWLLGDANYLLNFMVLALLVDIAIKIILFYIAGREQGSIVNVRSYLPLLLYSITVPFISYFYLQRFDLWPALLSVLALWFFIRNRYDVAGFFLALSIGVKFYPILFVLPLLAITIREGRWKQFIFGNIVGFMPIVILSFYMPWWKFAVFQGARGLQVESLYASVIWLWHFFTASGQYSWVHTTAWFEVQGPLALSVLPWARICFIVAVFMSTIYATYLAYKMHGKTKETTSNNVAYIARLMLLPLLSFMVFSLVFSPQYLIWLLPIAVIASIRGSFWPILGILVACTLTSQFYPVNEYFGPGLNLVQTIALVSRNLLLAGSWVWLLIETYHHAKKT